MGGFERHAYFVLLLFSVSVCWSCRTDAGHLLLLICASGPPEWRPIIKICNRSPLTSYFNLGYIYCQGHRTQPIIFKITVRLVSRLDLHLLKWGFFLDIEKLSRLYFSHWLGTLINPITRHLPKLWNVQVIVDICVWDIAEFSSCYFVLHFL